MVGQHGEAEGLLADQLEHAPADLVGGVAVEGQRDDGAGRHPAHAQQVGDAVHDHPRLAGAGTGEDQPVAVVVVGDDELLRGVERPDYGLPRGLAGGQGEDLVLAGEIAAQELLLAVAEVVQHQAQGGGHFLEGDFRILAHHVHLDAPLAVVLVEALEVLLEVALALALRADGDGHGPAHHGHAVVESQHLLLVQVQQRMFNGRLALLRRDIGTQLEIGVEQLV
ncbi:hypothetical protein D3C78_1241790 [compost metagenome]